jgi:uncharacterized membrane protein
MEELIILIVALLLIAVLIIATVLPIVALVISIRSRRKLNELVSRLEVAGVQPVSAESPLSRSIQSLVARIDRIETTLATHSIFPTQVDERPIPVTPTPPPTALRPPTQASNEQAVPRPSETTRPVQSPWTLNADQLESMIGRRWLGWAAVALILFATAFFLKYAFDNRWIGELGRVAIGVAAGVIMTALGFKYHKRGWRIFSQILTGGGIVLLYLSAYAAFGYYNLVPQKAAFGYLAILVAEAAGLALLYNAPAIAIMALVGGFLTPLLLHSDRDQYLSLFGYLIAIDVGALAVLKHWRGLRTLALVGTHLLFWLWYVEHYHPKKVIAVMGFQGAVFLIFLLAHVGRRLLTRRSVMTFEDIWLLIVNPLVFFATTYHLLNPNHHGWMGVFAIVMALVYAGAAKLLLDRSEVTRHELLSLIGIALTFVTIAIPIQLRSNWITIAWSVEALVMLWAGIETRTQRLRVSAYLLFGLALMKLLAWDTPYLYRPVFTPIFNRYFLSSLAVLACVVSAAVLYKRLGQRRQLDWPQVSTAFVMVAAVALWFLLSIETHTYFAARAAAERIFEDATRERWLGQMALSVVWATYAAALAAIGFGRRSASTRWASLALFALTIIKVMLVDIASLQRLYRIVVFFVLGLLLLMVAWAYHKVFYSRESAK